MEERSDKFAISQNVLTKDAAALNEYRTTQTNGNHNFARSYLGAEPQVQSKAEWWPNTFHSSFKRTIVFTSNFIKI